MGWLIRATHWTRTPVVQRAVAEFEDCAQHLSRLAPPHRNLIGGKEALTQFLTTPTFRFSAAPSIPETIGARVPA